MATASLTDPFFEVPLITGPMGTKFHSYLVVGFPNSKNKKILKNRMRSNRWSLLCTAFETSPFLSADGYNDNNHIFLKFDKDYSTDSDGRRINSLNPTGVSGGAVFDMGKLLDSYDQDWSKPSKAHLAGIAIEYHKEVGAIVAIRMRTIGAKIDQLIESNEL